MNIEVSTIQVTEDISWKCYQLTNDNGMEVQFLDYGGVITKIRTPDRKGNVENIVLGYKNYRDYLDNPAFLGGIIGRVAGRIKGAAFTVKNQTYKVSANEGSNHLHGGKTHFHKVLWKSSPFVTANTVGAQLSYFSSDGEDGYPGNVQVDVIYELTNDNELVIKYQAKSDQATPLALTNHTYFNLSGNLKETIHNHQVTISSHQFLELDSNLLPTGNISDVEGTPFDFRHGRLLKDGIGSNHHQNTLVGNGYDHYFLFDRQLKYDVLVQDLQSGRQLMICTDEPGMVLYTGNNLGTDLELLERSSRKYLGLCLETQVHPASLHYQGLPSVILEPGKEYSKKTVFRFSVSFVFHG
ncbi:MAG: galactose mutarotase [Brevibacillus sp.]|nr:galactose mutarotase [Brevibacillus sp.]